MIDWFLLVCRGCEHVFAQKVSTNSEDLDQRYDETGDVETIYNETIDTWPAISKRNRPDWMSPFGLLIAHKESRRLEDAMGELYGALDAGLNTLASIGVRTSFDIAAELLGVSAHQTFEQKLDRLLDKGHIREAERDHLALLVEAGSASAHRGWNPTFDDLDTLMDILENFIHESFVVPLRRRESAERIAEMKGKVPGRVPKPKVAH